MIHQDIIPPEKLEPVARALREAFGATGIEDIRRMTKGHNYALVLRIVVKGSPCLLRIAMRRNSIIGPEREFTCMKAASEAGLAPRIHYASLEDQISITDFVEEAPFPFTDALVRMPRLLRSLHALPAFPGTPDAFNTTCTFLMKQGPAVEGLIQKCRASAALASLAKEESEEFFAALARTVAIYPHHAPDPAPSHNDMFKPDNILFDGNRPWLVDWEAAFQNDRYVDLAAVANMLVASDAEEAVYLGEYFGQPPNEYQRARFFLMRQTAYMFYTMVFLLLSPEVPGEPDLKDFRRRYWSGQIDLTDARMKAAWGRFNWEELRRNLRTPRFGESLKIIAGSADAPRSSSNKRIP